MQRTLVLLKPDTLQRGLAGQVISRLERRGLKIVATRMVKVDQNLAHRLYEIHIGKPFFSGLVKFITSSPIIALVLEGNEVVNVVRHTIGDTDPANASPGSIRGDFGLDIGRNIIHGSDSIESAKREIELFFEAAEVISYQRAVDPWITES